MDSTTRCLFEIDSKNQLMAALANLVPQVLPKRHERTQDQFEFYCLSHLLRSLAYHNRLDYPLSLTKRESPDFLLQIPGKKIGVEVTELVHPNAAKYENLESRNIETTPKCVPVHYAHDGTKGSRQLRVEIQEDNPGSPIVGDRIEIDWARAVHKTLGKKNETATNSRRKQRFKLFDENWLLILTNWNWSLLDFRLGLDYFKYLYGNEVEKTVFDRVLILNLATIYGPQVSGPSLAVVFPTGYEVLAMPNRSPEMLFEVDQRLASTLGQRQEVLEGIERGEFHPAMAAFGLWSNEADLADLAERVRRERDS